MNSLVTISLNFVTLGEARAQATAEYDTHHTITLPCSLIPQFGICRINLAFT